MVQVGHLFVRFGMVQAGHLGIQDFWKLDVDTVEDSVEIGKTTKNNEIDHL